MKRLSWATKLTFHNRHLCCRVGALMLEVSSFMLTYILCSIFCESFMFYLEQNITSLSCFSLCLRRKKNKLLCESWWPQIPPSLTEQLVPLDTMHSFCCLETPTETGRCVFFIFLFFLCILYQTFACSTSVRNVLSIILFRHGTIRRLQQLPPAHKRHTQYKPGQYGSTTWSHVTDM